MIDTGRPVRGRRIPTGPVPGWVDPMLATLVSSPPEDGGWVYERKFDGIRALSFGDGGAIRLYSRNKLPLEESFPGVVEALTKLRYHRFVLDGEIVAIVGGTIAGFQALQRREQRTTIRYYVFDVPILETDDLRPLPLSERRTVLRGIPLTGALRRTTLSRGDPERLLDRACEAGWEGLIAKRDGAPYRAGRSRDWLKLKCQSAQELVVGGFTDPKGSRMEFGALLVGTYEGGELRFAGEVGTGFSEQMLRDLGARLKRIETDRSPFVDHPRAKKGQHFVRPRIVVQVAFSEWTHDGKLRHPRFQGLRADKSPSEVVRERPVR